MSKLINHHFGLGSSEFKL